MRHFKHRRRRFAERRPNKRLGQIFYAISQELGNRAELSVDTVLAQFENDGKLPQWLHRWEQQKHDSYLDKRGVDFVFTTDVGRIMLQVKSSKTGASIFKRKGHDADIGVVIVDIRDDSRKIFNAVMAALAQSRKKIMIS